MDTSTPKEIFNEFAGFLLVWGIAITLIEYNGTWWLDMLGDVIGGVALILFAKSK